MKPSCFDLITKGEPVFCYALSSGDSVYNPFSQQWEKIVDIRRGNQIYKIDFTSNKSIHVKPSTVLVKKR